MESKKENQSAEFEEYRRNMHRDTDDQGRPVVPEANRPVRIAFGIFMILLYVAMGVLLCINFFGWSSGLDWIRWIVGVVLIIYGFYRGYRMFV